MGEVKKMDSEKGHEKTGLRVGIDGKVDPEQNKLILRTAPTHQTPVRVLERYHEPLNGRKATPEIIEPSAPTVDDRRPKPHGFRKSTANTNYKADARELVSHKYPHYELPKHGASPQKIRISHSIGQAARAEIPLWQRPEIRVLATDKGESALVQGVKFELTEASRSPPKATVLQSKTPQLKIFSQRPAPAVGLFGRLFSRHGR